mgnify:CR=1 FL=1
MTTTTIEDAAKTERSNANLRAKRKQAASRGQPRTKPTTVSKRNPLHEQSPAETRVTKHALLLQLLSRADGATIADLMQATNWQQHSVRGFLAGTVKKKLSLILTSTKVDGEPRRYRIGTSHRGR